MKKREFDFEVMSSERAGHIAIAGAKEECPINCYELVFGKNTVKETVSQKDEGSEDEDDGKKALLASPLVMALTCLSALASALLLIIH